MEITAKLRRNEEEEEDEEEEYARNAGLCNDVCGDMLGPWLTRGI